MIDVQLLKKLPVGVSGNKEIKICISIQISKLFRKDVFLNILK